MKGEDNESENVEESLTRVAVTRFKIIMRKMEQSWSGILSGSWIFPENTPTVWRETERGGTKRMPKNWEG